MYAPPLGSRLRGFEGNVWTVTAIANYTERVADPSLSPDAHEEALKFLGESIGCL